MSPKLPVTRIGFRSPDVFPLFVDYDMQEIKCRGLSSKLDLFSYGALTREIEKLQGNGLKFAVAEGVLIRKSCLLFGDGFFLFDFNYFMEHLDKFVEKIKQLNLEIVYVENSERFDMELLVNAAKPYRVELVEFSGV